VLSTAVPLAAIDFHKTKKNTGSKTQNRTGLITGRLQMFVAVHSKVCSCDFDNNFSVHIISQVTSDG